MAPSSLLRRCCHMCAAKLYRLPRAAAARNIVPLSNPDLVCQVGFQRSSQAATVPSTVRSSFLVHRRNDMYSAATGASSHTASARSTDIHRCWDPRCLSGIPEMPLGCSCAEPKSVRLLRYVVEFSLFNHSLHLLYTLILKYSRAISLALAFWEIVRAALLQ